MATITDVTAYALEAPRGGSEPHDIAGYASVLVAVDTSDGIRGWGESIAREGGGVTAYIVNHLLKPAIIGHNSSQIERVAARMFDLLKARGHLRGFVNEALSGVEIALWDAFGKSVGLPVATLLGGCGRTRVPAYATIPNMEPHALLDAVARKVDEGYRCIKVKIGRLPVRDEAEKLRAVRAAAGPQIDLAADANGAYDVSTALRIGRHLERLDYRWFEEPVAVSDLDGYRRLAGSLDVALAAGECEFTGDGFRALLEAGVGVLQPNISRAGGFTGVRRVSSLAAAFHRMVAPHIGPSGPLCVAASLHFAAAAPEVRMVEHMAVDNPLLAGVVAPPLPDIREGAAAVPEGAGLGVNVIESRLRQFQT